MRTRILMLGLLSTFACELSPGGKTRQGSTDAGPSAADCRGPGAYAAGKEGSYRPCCSGLTEVFHQLAAYGENNVPVCVEPLLRLYACVRGTCGDGICEVGEARRCGCVPDCPGAAWGPQDAGAPTDGTAAP